MDQLQELVKELEQLKEIEEEFPGQRDDHRRQVIIEAAVRAADELIMEGSDGSEEETHYLTSMVAIKLVEKVHFPIQGRLLHCDLMARSTRASS
jgi:hypothetical protein